MYTITQLQLTHNNVWYSRGLVTSGGYKGVQQVEPPPTSDHSFLQVRLYNSLVSPHVVNRFISINRSEHRFFCNPFIIKHTQKKKYWPSPIFFIYIFLFYYFCPPLNVKYNHHWSTLTFVFSVCLTRIICIAT